MDLLILRRRYRAVLTAAVLAGFGCAAYAGDFAHRTRLFDASVGQGLSAKISDVSYGSITLASGDPLQFDDWYSSNWTDLEMVWMTAIDNNFGIFWGFSTGEAGPKYQIDPSLRLGFLVEEEFNERESLTFSVLTSLGGHMSERPCHADYGVFGSNVAVNCRLAATPMRPKQTLRYLFSEHPLGTNQVSLRYQQRF